MQVDPGVMVDHIEKMINDFFRLIPNLVISLVVFAIFYFAARWVDRGVRRLVQMAGRTPKASLVFGRIGRYATVVTGLLFALMVVIPSFTPTTYISALGVGSVAIGFAFRDILQNFLAGFLILLTEPFRIGDQIVVKNFEGTVDDIEVRATKLRTYDGRLVVIPNATLFTESVIVNTAFEKRRTDYDIGIGYGDDIERARALILEAVRGVEEVCDDPEPDVRLMGLDESTVNLRTRWWTNSRRSDVIRVQDKVLTAIKIHLTEAGVDLPFPTQVVLFHDQTEETDGNRRLQREGWPAGKGEVPKPRPIAATDGRRRTTDDRRPTTKDETA